MLLKRIQKNTTTIILLFISLYTTPLTSNAQHYPSWDIHFPLSESTYISGSFGELRSNHFHSGIDFTTHGKTGLEIKAIDKGYITRIAVSPGGFGKAIYINHPNGYTSVYAHCKSFSENIEKLVTDLQYKKKSFAIDTSFAPNEIPVKRGQLIAYSGNSGSSGGPHLHFEIRETKGQKPINPYFFNVPVKDDVSPVINAVTIYPLDVNSTINGKNEPLYLPATFYEGQYHLKGNPKISARGIIGVGIETLDYLSDSWRKCGVYSIQLTVDNKKWFRSQIDGFYFHQTRYINSHIDYASKYKNRKVIQKSFLDENNKLEIYTTTKEKGKISIQNGKTHELSYEVSDAAGNKSLLSFKINGLSYPTNVPVKTDPDLIKINPEKPYFISIENYKATFPANSFYTKITPDFKILPNTGKGIGSYFKVLNEKIPIHKYFEINIPLSKETKDLKGLTGAIIKNGRLYFAGGKIKDDNMVIRTRQGGTYCLTTDVTPPSIRFVNLPTTRNYSQRKAIKINIKDDFSGIASYQCKIDGAWALFEYDPKSNSLTGYFEKLRINKGSKHLLEVLVKDNTGNENIISTEFIY